MCRIDKIILGLKFKNLGKQEGREIDCLGVTVKEEATRPGK